jgi:antitoxin CptB
MTETLQRLQWRCRRGMLELDVLLGNFLTQRYATLSPDQQQAFVRLLDCSDQLLLEWLLQDASDAPAELREIIAIIKSTSTRS